MIAVLEAATLQPPTTPPGNRAGITVRSAPSPISPLLLTVVTSVSHLAFAFCCFVWGSTFILLDRVTHVFGPVEIGIWRMATGAGVIAFAWWYHARDFRLSRRDWAHIIFISLLTTAPPQAIQPYVLAQGFGHSFFGTLVAPIPLLTILVSVPMLGIWPSSRQLLGVLGGLACLWLIVDDGFDRGMSLGLVALAFTIPLASAFGNTYIKWKLPHVPAAPLTASILAVAAVSMVPLQFWKPALDALHLGGPVDPVVTPTAVTYLLMLGVIASGLSTLVFLWMVLKEGPLFAGMTTYVVPVLALLWGQFDAESISGQQIVAIIGVLAMVGLVQFGARKSALMPAPSVAGAQTVTLPGVVANAIAGPHIIEEPHRVIATPVVDFGMLDSRASQAESQVA